MVYRIGYHQWFANLEDMVLHGFEGRRRYALDGVFQAGRGDGFGREEWL
jgi:hypothetical protein